VLNTADGRTKPMVLMVDVDLDTRDMSAVGLSLLGLTVVAAGDADAAFELACEVEPDVIVTDVSLPGSDVTRLLTDCSGRSGPGAHPY
jgi:CheY-like chemotaxis protein